jgi:prophage regulatory protein
MANGFETTHTDKIIRLKEVLQMVGISRTSLYRLMDQGAFPQSQKLSKRCVGWKRSLIIAWMNGNMAPA